MRVLRAGVPLLLVLCAAAPAAAAVDIPPPAGRSVHDPAGIIDAATEAVLEARHRALFDATGVAIAVIAVPRLEDEPIEDFALRVATTWGAGRKGEDRGIVIAFALEERRIFVATGYGVEGFLPDGRVGDILDSAVIPLLRRNEFARGLDRASAALAAAAAEEFGVTLEGLPAGIGRPARRAAPILTPLELAGLILVLGILAGFLVAGVLAAARGGGRRSFRRGYDGWTGFGGGGFGGGGFGGGGGSGGFGGFGGGGFGGGGAGRGF
jgi:uncharacterized protein